MLSSNKYLNALLKVMLFSAVIHLNLIGIYSIINQNADELNILSITGFDLFFPEFSHSIYGKIASVVFIVGAYVGFLLIRKVKKKKKR